MPRHPTAHPNGGWYFDFPQRDGVHHLNFVANAASLANAARIREVRVEALE
jgi:hypothetical protein